MEVVFSWNISNDLVIKTVKFMVELDSGDNYGFIKKCLREQCEIEKEFQGRILDGDFSYREKCYY
jgi:hypothetical protein